MSFEDNIRALAARVPATLAHLETEEATKNALVLPFIAAMGYDVFNPLEVVPEYTADVGTKRGEKVDYAIKYGGDIVMLVEAKKAEAELTVSHASQLYRYFSVTDTSRIALLTNGVIYKFYSDIDAPNRMDEKPFLVVDLLNLKDDQLSQLSKLTKDAFDLDGMLEAAGDLKYMREIRRILSKQYDDPDDEFVRFFFAQCCPSRNFVQSARDQFSKLVVSSMHQVVADRVSARLRSALERETETGESTAPAGVSPSGRPEAAPAELDAPAADSPSNRGSADGVVTTEEEIEGFNIVRAIVCNVVAVDRVTMRDTKSYCGILLDDNNRRPICRLHFNRAKKYVGLFDDSKNETRHALEQTKDLYQFADQLRAAATQYSEAAPSKPTASEEGASPEG